MRIEPIGETALAITPAGEACSISAVSLAEILRQTAPTAVTDILPAFDTVTVIYDPLTFRAEDDPISRLCEWVRGAPPAPEKSTRPTAATIELPVRYGGDDGPDLEDLSRRTGLAIPRILELHSATTYTVAAVGFLPGFAYLDGLSIELQTPRRGTPRTRVPAGSVAIGGPYTGVYPIESPGGWHLIGRTTAVLFDPNHPAAIRFRVGDHVRFVIEGGR